MSKQIFFLQSAIFSKLIAGETFCKQFTVRRYFPMLLGLDSLMLDVLSSEVL